jgi:hypothetical protein
LYGANKGEEVTIDPLPDFITAGHFDIARGAPQLANETLEKVKRFWHLDCGTSFSHHKEYPCFPELSKWLEK